MTPLLSALFPVLLGAGCDLVITDAEHAARLDADGDGHIAVEHGGDDCDDDDATIHPGADEECDGVDNDCDDDIDEDVSVTVYDDADGDGYGDSSTEHLGCKGDPDVTIVDGDCDDENEAVHPDATEVCGDGVDDDCSGDDSPCPPIDLGEVRSGNGSAPGDLYGFALAGSGAALVVGAPGWNGDRGAVSFHEDASTGSISLNSGDIVFRGTTDGDRVGTAVALVGNMLGTGQPTIAIGAPGSNGGSGAVYLLSPDHSGDVYPVQADASVEPVLVDLSLGQAVSRVGDVTGDDADDMVVGAPAWSNSTGAAVIVPGPITGIIDPLTDNHYWTGESEADDAGRSLAGAGDVDGDGVNDVLVGAWTAGGDLSGATYLLLGPITSSGTLADADAILRGNPADISGLPLAGGGDVDGDGRADFAIEAIGLDTDFGSVGTTFLFSGVDWTTGTLPSSIYDATATITQGADGDTNAPDGLALRIRGDFNEDGRDDLIIGQPGHASKRGSVSLFLSPLEGTLTIHDAYRHLQGVSGSDRTGTSATTLTIDADGRDDIIVGAPGVDEDQGAIYVVTSSEW